MAIKMVSKKAIRGAGRAAVWFIALVLLLVIIAEIAIAGAAAWLHAEGGQNWLRSQVAAATQGSGFKADFAALSYRFPKGITIEGLEVADAQGVFAEADYVSIRPGFLPLAARHLSLAVDAGTMVLHRLPQGGGNGEGGLAQEAQGGFVVPRIYFTNFSLNDLSIDTLDLRAEVAGLPLLLSPRIDARIDLNEDIAVSLNAVIRQRGDEVPDWLPHTIEFRGTIDQALRVAIDELALGAPVYDLAAGGSVDFAGNALGLRFSGQAQNLARLSPALAGSVAVSGSLQGVIDAPVAKAELRPMLAVLEQAGLAAVSLQLEAAHLFDAPAGKIAAAFRYRERPVELAADFAWRDPQLVLSAMEGSAPDLAVSGALAVSSADGMLDGTVNVRSENFAAYSDLLGFDFGGRGTVAATFSPGEGVQALTLKADLLDVMAQGMSAAQAELSATLPSLSSPWPEQGSLRVRGLQVTDTVSFTAFSAQASRLGDDAFRLTLGGDGRALRPFRLEGTADVAGLGQGFPAISGIDLTLQSQDSQLQLAGALDAQQADLRLQAEDFALAALPLELPPVFQALTLSGSAEITGPPGQPVIGFSAGFSPLGIAGANIRITAEGGYSQGTMTAALQGAGEGINSLSGNIALPLGFSLVPFAANVPEGAQLSGALTMDAEAGVLSAALLPPGHELTGELAAAVKVSGALARPDIDGTLTLHGGAYHYEPYELVLSDLTLRAGLEPGALRIETLTANDGEGGRLTAAGILSLQDPQGTDISAGIEDFHLLRSDRADGYVAADLALTGSAGGYMLRGRMDIGPMNIAIPERFQQDIPELNIVRVGEDAEPDESLQKVGLDIVATAENRVFVRGWGLDAEFGGALEISGTLDHPEFEGMLKSVRGRYEEFGRRFELEHANLRFHGASPPSPYLDIKATTELEEILASVLLTGPLEDPELAFSSVPPLPDDEVLARILFGRDLAGITPFQAVQLKQTIDRFTGRGGGFDPLAQIRDLTGIDDITVDTGAEGGATVGVGKYLTDKVYLELEKGQGESSGGANLEIELTPRISLESKIGQDAQTGAGISWSWDY